MSITAHRSAVLAIAVGAGSAFALAGSPALAQVDPAAAANVLVECAKIGDSAARLACFDNNIRNLDPAALRSLPPRSAASSAPRAPGTPAAQAAQGFGFESVRVRQERFEPRPESERQVQAVIAAVREREPGIYLVTLEDGAEWVFAEGVDRGFRPPRRGQSIEIERGALGSFLMEIDEQRPVPVRRLR